MTKTMDKLSYALIMRGATLPQKAIEVEYKDGSMDYVWYDQLHKKTKVCGWKKKFGVATPQERDVRGVLASPLKNRELLDELNIH